MEYDELIHDRNVLLRCFYEENHLLILNEKKISVETSSVRIKSFFINDSKNLLFEDNSPDICPLMQFIDTDIFKVKQFLIKYNSIYLVAPSSYIHQLFSELSRECDLLRILGVDDKYLFFKRSFFCPERSALLLRLATSSFSSWRFDIKPVTSATPFIPPETFVFIPHLKSSLRTDCITSDRFLV